MRVRIADMVSELTELQAKPWMVTHYPNGDASVAVLLPMRKGMRRLVLSVFALGHIIESRWEEIVGIVLDQSEALAIQALRESANDWRVEPIKPQVSDSRQRAYA